MGSGEDWRHAKNTNVALTMRHFGLSLRLSLILAACFAISKASAAEYFSGTVIAPAPKKISSQTTSKVVRNGNTRYRLKTNFLKFATLMTLSSRKMTWPLPGQFSRRELLNLSLGELRGGKSSVPPIYLNHFPADMASLNSPRLRKDIFIKTVLPLVLRANSEVRLERQRMLVLLERIKGKFPNEGLTPTEHAFLTKLAVEYGVGEMDFVELQQRVDVVPASLALAQGAEESGWGTSRFARLGNAVFGQRTFRKGDGLVPLRRERGERYEVKSFNNLYKSVRAYVWNLNTHFAYSKFRAKRASLRNDGLPLDGYVLTGTLDRYSERGVNYISAIRAIIQRNRLDEFDDVRLSTKFRGKWPS